MNTKTNSAPTFDPKTMTRNPVAGRSSLKETNPVRVATTCPSLKDVDGKHLQDLSLALQGGFWAQISTQPEVVGMLKSEALTAKQGARLAEIAREFIATGKPQGLPWDGWNILAGLRATT